MSGDITAIKQTLATYCHTVDRGTPEEVSMLFAEDAVLRPYYDGKYDVVGRSRIKDWYAYYNEHFASQIRHLKHLIHSMSIELDGNNATSVCYLTAYFISPEDGNAYMAQGTYNDTLSRHGDNWLFQSRQIDVEFVTNCGTAIEEMTPLGFPHD